MLIADLGCVAVRRARYDARRVGRRGARRDLLIADVAPARDVLADGAREERGLPGARPQPRVARVWQQRTL